jgi:hypothetical protein
MPSRRASVFTPWMTDRSSRSTMLFVLAATMPSAHNRRHHHRAHQRSAASLRGQSGRDLSGLRRAQGQEGNAMSKVPRASRVRHRLRRRATGRPDLPGLWGRKKLKGARRCRGCAVLYRRGGRVGGDQTADDPRGLPLRS